MLHSAKSALVYIRMKYRRGTLYHGAVLREERTGLHPREIEKRYTVSWCWTPPRAHWSTSAWNIEEVHCITVLHSAKSALVYIRMKYRRGTLYHGAVLREERTGLHPREIEKRYTVSWCWTPPRAHWSTSAWNIEEVHCITVLSFIIPYHS